MFKIKIKDKNFEGYERIYISDTIDWFKKNLILLTIFGCSIWVICSFHTTTVRHLKRQIEEQEITIQADSATIRQLENLKELVPLIKEVRKIRNELPEFPVREKD
ncbi:MAG: hypothetical protein PHY56_00245 [Candidatus Omnitrophica bacterium]|nr:hypothetical protein [Candidatus Omnitrophota bacterium]